MMLDPKVWSVEERMERLDIGESLPVSGHKQHWRNIQSLFKKRYPERTYKIYYDREESMYVCTRKK